MRHLTSRFIRPIGRLLLVFLLLALSGQHLLILILVLALALKRTTTTLSTKKFLMYTNGVEGVESVVIDASTLTADSDGKKIVPGGALFVKITASGKYGPYDEDALDGRQTLGVGPNCVIISDDLDVTNGNAAIGGIYGEAHFDASELTLYGASLSDVKTAMPACHFL